MEGVTAADILSRLHLLTYGGGPLPSHCPPVLASHNILLCCTYGQTELAGPVMFGQPGGDPDLLRPFKAVTYRLEREVEVDGEDEGELVLLGNASATAGYLSYTGTPQYRSLSSTTTTAAEYRTGDRFRIERVGGGGDGSKLAALSMP